MIEQLSKKYSININNSFMIGDRASDIKSGKLAGCKTIFIDRNYSEKKPKNQDFTVKSMNQAVKIIQINSF
jgi:histidinol phosphatase-like enzyme